MKRDYFCYHAVNISGRIKQEKQNRHKFGVFSCYHFNNKITTLTICSVDNIQLLHYAEHG